MKVAITCVRVPVLIGHGMSVCVEFQKKISVEDAREAFEQSEGLSLQDRPRDDLYVTPLECAGSDEVFISRLRQDTSVSHGLTFWAVADNLRKGAALNAVQIAETLVQKGHF